MQVGRKWSLAAAVALFAAASAANAALVIIQQQGNSFNPQIANAQVGDTVRWVWNDGFHTVTSGANCTPDGRFDALLDPNNTTFEYVIPPNVTLIPYYCIPHCAFGMDGEIRVSQPLQFQVTLDGYQENPPVRTTPATGSGTVTLDPNTLLLSWNITFQGLLGTQTAAHFHGPAGACANAGVVVPLPNGSPIVGSTTITQQQANEIQRGLWYVNIHSTMFPGGEIRGAVMPTPLTNPIGPTIQKGALKISLQTVATGLVAPNWGASAPGIANRLYVTDQDGVIWAVNPSTGAKFEFLNVRSRLVPLGINGPNSFDERGLLGLAFDPNFATNGRLYTYTSEPYDSNIPADFSTMEPNTTPNCVSVLTEWQVVNPADPNTVVNPSSRREFMRVDKPQFNHNGGGMLFGPDGYLYVSFGDGGGRDDRDDGLSLGRQIVGHGCTGNGQNINTILGKIIRIDPHGNNSQNGKYGVPTDNPFVGMAGLDEIWAWGLRNPWRIAFDTRGGRGAGDLFVADVGQNRIEELNLVTKGGNYGWRAKEGSFYFIFNGNQAGYVTDRAIDVPPNLIDPIAEYDRDDGISIIGGFVSNGSNVPSLADTYVFGEFAKTFQNDGRLFYLTEMDHDMFMIEEFNLIGRTGLNLSLLGFGQDANGVIYVMANGTGIPFGTTGVVLRIGPPRGDMNCDGVINFADINPFVLALSDPNAYQQQFPNCNIVYADANEDGDINFADINAFVELLSGGF